MAKLNVVGTAGFNAGKNYYARPMRIEDIIVDEEISRVFKLNANVMEEITQNMQEAGYDKSQPIVIWKEKNTLLDGHTRLAAAKQAGLEEIPTVEMEFEDKESAIMYTFERQVIRRNLTPEEILEVARMIPKRKAPDGTGRSVDILAKRLGISPAHMYQARKIVKQARPEDIQAIKDKKKSIKEVYLSLGEAKPRRNEPAEFPVSDAQGLPANVKFLRAAVKLLVESMEKPAAKLLIEHFLKKQEREGFYRLLPEEIKKEVLFYR